MNKLISLLSVVMLTGCVTQTPVEQPVGVSNCITTDETIIIPLTLERHPNIIAHARRAIAKGYPGVYVLHREGASERRKELLKDYPTKPGLDRDEAPPSVGRAVVNADVEYVPSSENRSAGAIMGLFLKRYCDGTKFKYNLV